MARVAVGAILLLTLLSGCTGTAPEPADPAEEDPILHTRPGEFVGTTDPTKFHLHDYWLGADQILVLQDEQRATLTTVGASVNRLQFRPASGDVVPLGTGNVSVTMTWDAETGSVYGPVHLYVKTQADNESQDVGVIESGVPFRVATTNDHNDLPHQLLSAWSFDFFLTPDPQTDLLRFYGDVQIEVIAERSLPIPLFPPHPDHWGNETGLPLFDETVIAGHMDHTPAPNRICFEGCLPVHVPRDDAIVPPGAAIVRIVLELAEGATGDVVLAYHGADQREWSQAVPTMTDGATRSFDIEVAPGLADGPYSSSSLWEFQLQTVQTQENGLFWGGYTLQATVLRA